MAEVGAVLTKAAGYALAGFAVGNVFGAIIGGFIGAVVGVGEYENKKNEKTAYNPPPHVDVKPTVGGHTSKDPLADLPTAGATGTVDVPSADALAVARAKDEEAQRHQFSESSGIQIFGQKVQEQSAESRARAGIAARGLKYEGSPLAQLQGAKQMAEKQIALEERQRQSTLQGMQNQANIQYGTYLNTKSLDVYNQQQALDNMWLNNFAQTINLGSSLISKLWNPAQKFDPSTGSAGWGTPGD